MDKGRYLEKGTESSSCQPPPTARGHIHPLKKLCLRTFQAELLSTTKATPSLSAQGLPLHAVNIPCPPAAFNQYLTEFPFCSSVSYSVGIKQTFRHDWLTDASWIGSPFFPVLSPWPSPDFLESIPK